MSAIFISHSTKDHADTETMPSWLKQQGHTSHFIDYDEQSGIRPAKKENICPMGQRRVLVIGSQCKALGRLDFLPKAAQELYRAMTDPERVGSSTQVTPPPSFFRPNEFDTGAFGTFVTGLGSGANAGKHASGAGIDSTYWFPWKYTGVRFQGTGATSR